MTLSPLARAGRALLGVLAAILLLLLPLAIPPADPIVPGAPPDGTPFVWGRDSLWRSLEAGFVAARARGCEDSAAVRRSLGMFEARVSRVAPDGRDGTGVRATAGSARAGLAPESAVLDTLEQEFFALAPRVAACATLVDAYVAAYGRMRDATKQRSAEWDVRTPSARERLYRALYGGRAAVEEVMLQQPERTSPLLRGADEPSAAPGAESNGVRLHSGDILVSRGGYPTSALIARGNDRPGNFSHIALVHVDPGTRAISVIEAHIELGVAVTTPEGYLGDKKLRVMVLRPRADLPALRADPLLPHKAATAMLERARREHIPYDFAMDHADPSRLFCSEVASQAYRALGLELWMGISTISRPGLRQWLASFGVERFATQEPSDLEYDPQLRVVAEWHDAATLFDDHVDNAVTDAMLEGADRGDRLEYDWYALPLARVLKGYSVARGWFGRVGPVPEGMAAPAALRNRAYNARHDTLAARVRAAADDWRAANGYLPPYWELVELARDAAGRE